MTAGSTPPSRSTNEEVKVDSGRSRAVQETGMFYEQP